MSNGHTGLDLEICAINARHDEEFLRSASRVTFKVEAAEHLQVIAGGLMELEKNPCAGRTGRPRRKDIFRWAAHSLKGARREL